MPSKILQLCLVLVAICIKHETLSQYIVDFKCTVKFPISQTPGVAKEEKDIVTFSIHLDAQNADLYRWTFIGIMFANGDILGNRRRKNWITYMNTSECTDNVPSIDYQKRIPYKKCQRDPNNRRSLRMEIGVPASSQYNMSSLIAVWINRGSSYRVSNSARYPMVIVPLVADLSASKSDANELPSQPLELVLILVTLSGAAMWMTSTLVNLG